MWGHNQYHRKLNKCQIGAVLEFLIAIKNAVAGRPAGVVVVVIIIVLLLMVMLLLLLLLPVVLTVTVTMLASSSSFCHQLSFFV